jgi:hypothetical protein
MAFVATSFALFGFDVVGCVLWGRFTDEDPGLREPWRIQTGLRTPSRQPQNHTNTGINPNKVAETG